MKRLVTVVLFAVGCATAGPKPVAIVGATLIDGSGSAPQSNVTFIVRGDQIVAVRPDSVPRDATVIDAHGHVLAPGFIDMHNHSDRGLKDDPSLTSQVSQGITTIVVGQDGESAFPIADFLTSLDRSPVAVNVVTFVGQSTLRARAMGENNLGRAATGAEVAAMTAMVHQGMRDGAFGLSTGLEY